MRYLILITLATHLLKLRALDCPGGLSCLQDTDGTEVCPEESYTEISCPAGTHADPSLGVHVPKCSLGAVACIHQIEGTAFCYPGYICPAGSTLVGPFSLPSCPSNQQLCVSGSKYDCFDLTCPPGMIPLGLRDCATEPPKNTCPPSEKLCVYDLGNAFFCADATSVCGPGTHELKACTDNATVSLDWSNRRIVLANGHYIHCLQHLVRSEDKLICRMPVFDSLSIPTLYKDSKLIYLDKCTASSSSQDLPNSSSLGHLTAVAKALGYITIIGNPVTSSQVKILPRTWVEGYRYPNSSLSEYCYVEGRLLSWEDPKCKFSGENNVCFIGELVFQGTFEESQNFSAIQ